MAAARWPEEEKCADPAKARARALDALAGQEMSSASCMSGCAAALPSRPAAAVVAEMVQLDYVNDDRYAETRAHSLLAARKSRRAAAQNLRQKGLAARRSSRRWIAFTPRMYTARDPELEAAAALVAAALPQKAGRWPPRPCGGGPAAPGICVFGHKRSHPEAEEEDKKHPSNREREYHPL